MKVASDEVQSSRSRTATGSVNNKVSAVSEVCVCEGKRSCRRWLGCCTVLTLGRRDRTNSHRRGPEQPLKNTKIFMKEEESGKKEENPRFYIILAQPCEILGNREKQTGTWTLTPSPRHGTGTTPSFIDVGGSDWLARECSGLEGWRRGRDVELGQSWGWEDMPWDWHSHFHFHAPSSSIVLFLFVLQNELERKAKAGFLFPFFHVVIKGNRRGLFDRDWRDMYGSPSMPNNCWAESAQLRL